MEHQEQPCLILDRLWIVDNDTVFIYNPANSQLKKFLPGRNSGLQDCLRMRWPTPKATCGGTETHGILIADPKGMLSEHFNISNGLASNDVW